MDKNNNARFNDIKHHIVRDNVIKESIAVFPIETEKNGGYISQVLCNEAWRYWVNLLRSEILQSTLQNLLSSSGTWTFTKLSPTAIKYCYFPIYIFRIPYSYMYVYEYQDDLESLSGVNWDINLFKHIYFYPAYYYKNLTITTQTATVQINSDPPVMLVANALSIVLHELIVLCERIIRVAYVAIS